MTRAANKTIKMDYTESEDEGDEGETKDSTPVARFLCIRKQNDGEFSGCKIECCVCLHIFPTATAFNDHKKLEYCFRLVRRSYDPEPSNIIVPVKRSEEPLPELTREEKKEAAKAEREKVKTQKRESRACLRALYGYPSLEQMKAEMEQWKIEEIEDEEVQRYNEQAEARARRERRKKEMEVELEKKKIENEKKAALDSVKKELGMFGKIRKNTIRQKEKEMIKKNMERIEEEIKSKKEEEKRARTDEEKEKNIEEEKRMREEEEKIEEEKKENIEEEKIIGKDVQMSNEEMKEEKTEKQKKEKIGEEMEEKTANKMKRRRMTTDIQISEETPAITTDNRMRKRKMDEENVNEEPTTKKKCTESTVGETIDNGEDKASEQSAIFPQAEQYKAGNEDESKIVDPKKWKKKSEMSKIQILLTDKQSAALFNGLKQTTGDDGTQDVYECSFCLDKMSTLDDGRRHMLSHVRVIRFRCRLCDAGSFYNIDMQNHLKTGSCSEMQKALKQLHYDNLPDMTKKHTNELTIIANPLSPGTAVFTNGKIVSITSVVPYIPDSKIEKEIIKPKPAEM